MQVNLRTVRILPILLLILSICLASCGNEQTTSSSNTSESSTTSQKKKSVATEKIFNILENNDLGIDFENSLRQDGRLNFINFGYIYNGSGVAVGDINNDGLEDIYFVSPSTSNKLYLNKGDWKFEDITASSGTAAEQTLKTGVAMVDVNGDGWLDIYQCRTGNLPQYCKNLLFINNKDNTFTEQAEKYGLVGDSPTTMAYFFDYDLDGDNDVYLVNHLDGTFYGGAHEIKLVKNADGTLTKANLPNTPYQSDRLFKNEKNKFIDVTEKAGVLNRAFGLSACIADFNEDGYPDVLVANDFVEPDKLYINNKNGTFTDKVDDFFKHMAHNSMGSDLADVNNDGLLDLMIVDMLPEDNERQKKNDTNMKNNRYNRIVKYKYGHQYMRNTLQLNNGNGTFSDIACMANVHATDWSWCPLIADFDNDGLKDIFVTNGYRKDLTNNDYVNFTMPELMGKKMKLNEALKNLPEQKLVNYAFKNVNGISFEKVSSEWGLDQPSFSYGATYADLDNDGDLDLVVNNLDSIPFIYQNQADKNANNYLRIKLNYKEGNKNGILAKATIKYKDGIQTVVSNPLRGYMSTLENTLHFGLGDANEVESLSIVWPDNTEQILKGIKANQTLEVSYKRGAKYKRSRGVNKLIQESSRTLDNIFTHKENTFDDFEKQKLAPYKLSTQGPALAKGDINGDGLEDFYIGGATDQVGTFYVQTTSGNFKEKKTKIFDLDAYKEDVDALFFDADNDKDLDLYIVSGGSSRKAKSHAYEDRLYLNDGSGNFELTELPKMNESGSCVRAYDFDADGDLDLFLGARHTPLKFPTAPLNSILQNDNGTFKDITASTGKVFSELGMVTDIQFANMDQDEELEMIVCGDWTKISVLDFSADKWNDVSSSYGLDNTEGWWRSVTIADIDQDGDMDMIGGNLGFNSRYTEFLPLKLYEYDFDDNGDIDPMMTWVHNGSEFPLAIKDNLTSQVPSIKKKYIKYDDYSTATIQDLFGQEKLNKAKTHTCNILANCLFINDGGKFKRTELPIEAQLGPLNDVLIKDLNGDGHLDILGIGNDYSQEVETGRLDSSTGCILLNDGNNNFKNLKSIDSGLWADLEAKKLIEIQSTSGKEMIIVANNNDRVQVFTQLSK